MEGKKFVLSGLAHTWLLDLDGTIVKHNGYKIDGEDSLLKRAREFLASIPTDDMVIFLTSRGKDTALATEHFLKVHDIRYDQIIYGIPYGERILINDRKPSGLETAIAVSVERDKPNKLEFYIDDRL